MAKIITRMDLCSQAEPKIEKFVLTEMNLGRKKSLFSDGYAVFLQSLPLETGLNKHIFICSFSTHIC